MFGLVIPRGMIRYSVMPEVAPRMRDLFLSGFHYVPFFIAVVYQLVGLLPRNHAYLNQSNMGLFGIRHVVSEASRNIKFSLKNIDQIILFVAVIVGLIIFFVQFASLAMMLFMQPVMAMPSNWNDFFVVPIAYRSFDLSYMMLDMVFGVPHPLSVLGAPLGFFESCIGSPVPCTDSAGVPLIDIDLATTGLPSGIEDEFGPLASNAYNHFPFPYHIGMHRLFTVYSNGLLVIAVMIASYFIATILAETAQTGTPFGKRFNKTWAPIRIVVAFGLLMPISGVLGGSGLNSAQYIVLYAAKYGSGFATNGWAIFNTSLTDSLGDKDGLIATPNIPDVSQFLQFLYVAKVCRVAWNYYDQQRHEQETASGITPVEPAAEIEAYAVFNHSDVINTLIISNSTTYEDLLTAIDNPDVTNVNIRFGAKRSGVRVAGATPGEVATTSDTRFSNERGFVSPICGEINLTLNDARPAGDIPEPAPYLMQTAYYALLLSIWHDLPLLYPGWLPVDGGIIYPPPFPGVAGANNRALEVAYRLIEGFDDTTGNQQIKLNAEYVRNFNQQVNDYLKYHVDLAIAGQKSLSTRVGAAPDPTMPILLARGWAGAGIWYNRIAEVNGLAIAAIYATPSVSRYPAVMEKIGELKAKYNKEIDPAKEFEPYIIGVDSPGMLLEGNEGLEFAILLYVAQYDWSSGGIGQLDQKDSPFLQAITALLGLNGLYDLRDNVGTHPLAMLVAIGRSLVESAIRSLGYAALATTLGAINVGGSIAGVSASFFVSVAMMGLTVGFVLYYVVPFLPFIYFFFAVGGWIKGIFEAMVGAPLWALAHIRIDGQGLPGGAAINGYFLIFEVFLRPIMIIFGLLASITIFAALVDILHVIFPVVSNNIGGFDIEAEMTAPAGMETFANMRSKVDEFFFTVIYAIIVYLIGMSSFKLIDTIPNNILRWMGQSVATFGDQREDPAQGLVSKTSIGSQQALGKIGGGLQSGVKGIAG